MASNHSAAIKSNQEVWMWGNATSGALGDNSITAKSSPVLVVGAHSFIAISMGNTHSVGLKANGEAWAWGENGTNQLGNNLS